MNDLLLFENKGYYEEFSNFSYSSFRYAGNQYSSVEQYLMVQKACVFRDLCYNEILNTSDPYIAKQLGRTVHYYNEKLWSAIRPQILRRGVRAKFQQNSNLLKMLLNTGNKILALASPGDVLFGIGLHRGDSDANDFDKWRGRNLLGNVLMRVRSDLRIWSRTEKLQYKDIGYGTFSDLGSISALLHHPVAAECVFPFTHMLEYYRNRLNEPGLSDTEYNMLYFTQNDYLTTDLVEFDNIVNAIYAGDFYTWYPWETPEVYCTYICFCAMKQDLADMWRYQML